MVAGLGPGPGLALEPRPALARPLSKIRFPRPSHLREVVNSAFQSHPRGCSRPESNYVTCAAPTQLPVVPPIASDSTTRMVRKHPLRACVPRLFTQRVLSCVTVRRLDRSGSSPFTWSHATKPRNLETTRILAATLELSQTVDILKMKEPMNTLEQQLGQSTSGSKIERGERCWKCRPNS